MPRVKRSKEEIERIRTQIKIKNIMLEAEDSLLKEEYFRSKPFIIGLAIKILYIIFCFALIPLSQMSSYHTEEIYLDGIYNTTTYTSAKSGAKSSVRFFEFKTNLNEYVIPCGYGYVPALIKGDTLQIERNFLGKSTYINKENWVKKYNIPPNYIYYFMLGFMTIVALYFNDGSKYFDRRLNLFFVFLCSLFIAAYIYLK
jgi:hypothetical protein